MFVYRQAGRQDTKEQFNSLQRVQQYAIYYYCYFLSSTILLVGSVIARVARGQQEGLQYSRDNSVTQTTML
jgi:hypothetical protein